MTEDTEVQDEPTMDETMDKLFDEIQERDKEPEAEPAPKETQDSPEESDTPDASASATEEQAAQGSEAEDQTDNNDTPTDDAPAEQVEAPAYWSEESREKFDALPDEAKAVVLEQAKTSQADFTRSSQDLAEQRKAVQPLQDTLDKWKPYLAQLGVMPDQMIGTLMQAEYVLRTGTPEQKRQALNRLQQDYGISDAVSEDDEYRDPELASLKGEVEALSTQINQGQQAQQTAQMAQTNAVVEQFKAAVDDKGVVLHPHFGAVEGTMTALVAGGQATDLQAAYDMAVYADPTIREQLVADKVKQSEAIAKAASKQAADKAKKAASVNVSSSSAPGGSKKPLGKWDDSAAMSEIYDQAS